MKVYKYEVTVLDFEGYGPKEYQTIIEQDKYLNGNVLSIEEREIGEWYDEHPLKQTSTCREEYKKLFNSKNDPELKEQNSNLERFMNAVCQEVECLPDYNDSLPDGGNAHVIRKIKDLKSRTDKVFTFQHLTSNASGIFVTDIESGKELIIPTFGLDENKKVTSKKRNSPLIELTFDDLKPHIENALEAFIKDKDGESIDTIYVYGFIRNKKYMGILVSDSEKRLLNQNCEETYKALNDAGIFIK